MPAAQWREYAQVLDGLLDRLLWVDNAERLPLANIKHAPTEDAPKRRISLAEEDSHSIRIIAQELVWGGRAGNADFSFPTVQTLHCRQKERSELFQRLAEEAEAAGHHWLQREFSTVGLAEVLRCAPDTARRWIAMATENGEAAKSRIARASTFFSALCEMLLADLDWHSEAAKLYGALRPVNSPVRVVAAETGLVFLDTVLLGSRQSPDLLRLWDKRLAQCRNDVDLLELALMVRRASGDDSRRWARQVIADGLRSSVPFEQARALVWRGFLEDDPDAGWLAEPIPEQPCWSKQVLATAQGRVAVERNARHWFRIFCNEPDLVRAWAAFRLFLHCTDRRCWLWLDDEAGQADLPKAKQRFLVWNRERISRRCGDNEKKWKESFLGCKVESGVSPWLTIG